MPPLRASADTLLPCCKDYADADDDAALPFRLTFSLMRRASHAADDDAVMPSDARYATILTHAIRAMLMLTPSYADEADADADMMPRCYERRHAAS